MVVLQSRSATCSYNRWKKTHQLTATLIIWNKEVEETVHEGLQAHLGRNLSRAAVEVVPFQALRIQAADHNGEGFQLAESWTPLFNQPSHVSLRLQTENDTTCTQLMRELNDGSEDLLQLLTVQLSLHRGVEAKADLETDVRASLADDGEFRSIW